MFGQYNIFCAIVDILALSGIVALAILGAKNGFVKTFLTSFGSIISLLLAVLLCSSVAKFTESAYGWVSKVSNWLSNALSKAFGNSLMNTTLNEVTTEQMASGGIAGWLVTIVLTVKNDGSIPMDVTLNQVICPVFGYYLVCILAVIFLYIIFRLIFFVVGSIVQSMHSIRIIGAVDVSLGVLLGIIRAIVITQIIIMVISIIPLGFFQDIMVCVENSFLTRFINNINVFSLIVKAFGEVNVINIIKSTLKV